MGERKENKIASQEQKPLSFQMLETGLLTT